MHACPAVRTTFAHTSLGTTDAIFACWGACGAGFIRGRCSLWGWACRFPLLSLDLARATGLRATQASRSAALVVVTDVSAVLGSVFRRRRLTEILTRAGAWRCGAVLGHSIGVQHCIAVLNPAAARIRLGGSGYRQCARQGDEGDKDLQGDTGAQDASQQGKQEYRIDAHAEFACVIKPCPPART